MTSQQGAPAPMFLTREFPEELGRLLRLGLTEQEYINLFNYFVSACDDGCVGKLLDDIDYLMSLVDQTNLTGVSAAPWTRLFSLGDLTDLMKVLVSFTMR